jgi:hypothetical protein
MRFDYEHQSADVALDGAMTIEDSKRAEAPTALQAQCRGRIAAEYRILRGSYRRCVAARLGDDRLAAGGLLSVI